MNKRDLAQIKELFDEGFKRNFKPAFDEAFKASFPKAFQEGFGQIWEFNLEPTLNNILVRIDGLEDKVDKLPTKEYVDEKIGALRADINKKFATLK
jgi:hypothetical protein